MTLVWFSRHSPTPRQITKLKSLFGDSLTIVQDSQTFDGASDIAARYRRSGADDLVIVAPLAVVQALVKCNIFPIWAEMAECLPSHPQCEVTITPRHTKPRHYRFRKFWRINAIRLDLSELSPITKENTAHAANNQTA